MSLTRSSFDFVRETLRLRSAHCLEEDKQYLVETRLLPIARRHGFTLVEDFVVRLRSRPNELLVVELVEAMTINETFFFRDEVPFEVLRKTVLPELLARRADSRCLSIWSAACSSGQEPYSLAMLIRQHFPELAAWNVRLLATDLSSAMLERAQRGFYTNLEVTRGLPEDLRRAYLREETSGWQVQDDIRRMVEFRPLNLIGPWPALPPLDLVLLRNVLIYFDVPSKQRVLDRIRGVLRPDGYLVLGGAETSVNLSAAFRPVSFDQTSFFQPS